MGEEQTEFGRSPAEAGSGCQPTASAVPASRSGIPNAVWLTNESPPRRLIVKGTAALDPDVWVAEFEDGSEGYKGKTLWVVKSSGFVCGIRAPFDPKTAVYAKPEPCPTCGEPEPTPEIMRSCSLCAQGDAA